MAYFGKGHFFSYFGQFRFWTFQLEIRIEEPEKRMDYNPLKISHAYVLVQRFTLNKIQVRQFFVVFGFHKHAVQYHPDQPGDNRYGYAEGDVFNKHDCSRILLFSAWRRGKYGTNAPAMQPALLLPKGCMRSLFFAGYGLPLYFGSKSTIHSMPYLSLNIPK